MAQTSLFWFNPGAMFALRVHSVDDNHPLSISSNPNPNPSPNLGERRGMVHLFRSLSLATALPRTTSRTTLLFVVAVPNYLSSDDFIRFCGSHIDEVSELLIIRYIPSFFSLDIQSLFGGWETLEKCNRKFNLKSHIRGGNKRNGNQTEH